MLVFSTYALRFLLLLSARIVIFILFAGSVVAAWGYYGYQRVGCHPMFATGGNVECGELQVLAARHGVALLRELAPYQALLRTHQSELVVYGASALAYAIAIEMIFGFIAILLKRRAKRSALPGELDRAKSRS